MRYKKELLDEIKRFLPSTSEIAILDTQNKRLAVELADLDGDNILELACAYYWHGEYYIIILKYHGNAWNVLDTVKGKGYNITYFDVGPVSGKNKDNLIVGWQVGAIWSDLSIYELMGTKLVDLIKGNKYFCKLEVADIESTQEKNGTHELALWIHDTGDAYKIEIYRWLGNKLVLALDVYPYYFEKVANYYKKLLVGKDSTTYWYYLADAQTKTGNLKEACYSINKALVSEYPYPSIEKLMQLKKENCENRQDFNEHGIDFLSIKHVPSETKPDIKLEQALIKAFDLSQDENNVRYYYNKVDLNDDGILEVFVYIVGLTVCGTGGCSGAIFREENDEYTLLSKFTLVNTPVIISDRKTNGYKDIIMNVFGGGINSFLAELKYDGTTYPTNPSIQPKVESGRKLEGIAIITDDIAKNPGIELKNFKEINLANQVIIDVKVGNILGQCTHDKVILVGHYLYEDSPYVENVDIVIKPEESGAPIITKIPYTGYNLELFLGDFNGDERDEIMVGGEYGGSGGYAIAAVYQYKDGSLMEIFNPDMFSKKYELLGKYLEDYKVLVQSVTLKEKYIFDISKRNEIYLNMIYDESGKVKSSEEPVISAINGAYPIRIIAEKSYYLFIRQRVVGVSNADTIGYMESFVSLLGNYIKVVQTGMYQFGEKENLDRIGKILKEK